VDKVEDNSPLQMIKAVSFHSFDNGVRYIQDEYLSVNDAIVKGTEKGKREGEGEKEEEAKEEEAKEDGDKEEKKGKFNAVADFMIQMRNIQKNPDSLNIPPQKNNPNLNPSYNPNHNPNHDNSPSHKPNLEPNHHINETLKRVKSQNNMLLLSNNHNPKNIKPLKKVKSLNNVFGDYYEYRRSFNEDYKKFEIPIPSRERERERETTNIVSFGESMGGGELGLGGGLKGELKEKIWKVPGNLPGDIPVEDSSPDSDDLHPTRWKEQYVEEEDKG
jgi:hypothetical protein